MGAGKGILSHRRHPMRTVSVSLEITGALCLRVMPDVDGHPFQRWSLHGHGAQDEQGALHDLMGPEAAIRQPAMVANRHAKGDEGVHRSQQPHIGPVDGALPEHSSSERSSQERDKNDEENSFIE